MYKDNISQEKLYNLYITQNLTKKDICKQLQYSSSRLDRLIKKYNIVKPKNLTMENIKKTNIEKYGCISLLCKVRGNPNTPEAKEKARLTNLEKYGVENVFQSEEIKNKIKETNRIKYGYDNIAQTHISKNSLNILNDKDLLKEYILNCERKDINYICENLGISYSHCFKVIKKYNLLDILDPIGSSYESELKEILKGFKKDRKILSPKEIDFYNKDLKLGIEFNGNYWHSENVVDNKYHINKTLNAQKQNVFLYHIWEHEWVNERKKPIIISMINNLLGLNEKIYARKCEIKNVDNKEAADFLNLNHLQGCDFSSIKLGLYYKNELISLMTFGKPRFNNDCEYELIRFCNKMNTSVIGGASKLFKYFIKNYKPKSIISYSNVSKTKGTLYKTLGFKYKELTEPNYIWFKNNKNILSRYQCQKHILLKEGYKGNSESEIMRNRNYYKIYDCGNITWIWNE